MCCPKTMTNHINIRLKLARDIFVIDAEFGPLAGWEPSRTLRASLSINEKSCSSIDV